MLSSTEANLSLEAERTSDKFKYESFLGSGGSGLVFKATHTLHGDSPVALKLNVNLPNDPNDSDEDNTTPINKQIPIPELREFVNVQHLEEHPNIVATFDMKKMSFSQQEITALAELIGSTGIKQATNFIQHLKTVTKPVTLTCFVLQLCGNSLRNFLINIEDQFPLSLDAVTNFPSMQDLEKYQFKIVGNLMDGVTYLYQNKIIHRDLKPGNILFAQGYQLPVKLCDFGLTRRIHHNEESKSGPMTENRGTDSYMAPEVKVGKEYGHQADLYSLGVVLFEVLQPFNPYQDFKKFTEEGDISVVKSHPIITNWAELLKGLTKSVETGRFKTIQEVKLRVPRYVSNTEELQQWENDMANGDVVNLNEAEYIFDLCIAYNRVTINGKGATIKYKRFGIQIRANGCNITGPKLVRCESGNVIVGNPALIGIGENNVIKSLTICNGNGIQFYGKGNTVADIDYFPTKELCNPYGGGMFGLWFIRSADSSVDNFRCHGVFGIGTSDSKCWGIKVTESEKVRLSNCTVPNVYLDGSGFELENVDSGPLLVVRGSGHQILNCRAQVCRLPQPQNVQLTECNFRSEEWTKVPLPIDVDDTSSSSIKSVTLMQTAEQLKNHLVNRQTNPVQLVEGVFSSNSFSVELDNTVVRGLGTKTILKSDGVSVLQVTGNNCTISSLRIEGNPLNKHCGLYVKGNNNTFTDLTIANSYHGIIVEGCGNKFEDLRCENIKYRGLCIEGDLNEFNMLHLNGTLVGLSIDGKENKMSNIMYYHYHGQEEASLKLGMFIRGCGNIIDNFKCTGLSAILNYGARIQGTNNHVRNSVCGPGIVYGAHQLVNVDFGHFVKLIAGDSHFKNCKVRSCQGLWDGEVILPPEGINIYAD